LSPGSTVFDRFSC